MKKFRTPNIKEMRQKTGTFYSFTSAVEDIGLNISERHNVVRLSHYAILDIPDTEIKHTPENNEFDISNKFNLTSQIGNFVYDISGQVNGYPATIAIPQSFRNYALNLETNLLGSDNYNAVNNLTVSERVFWKWLKETGAIRYKNNNGYITEEDEVIGGVSTGYNRVVKAIGEINTGSFNINNWGSNTEVFVQLPTSHGTTPVIFKEIEDTNYHYGMSLTNSNKDMVIGDTGNITPDKITNYAFCDVMGGLNDTTGMIPEKNVRLKKFDQLTSSVAPGTWYSSYASPTTGSYMYIMDNAKFSSLNQDDPLNDIIITENLTSGFTSSTYIVRSKADCMSVDFNMSSYNAHGLSDGINLEEMALSSTAKDYSFNAILVYYTIYDNSGETALATNLLGVLFVSSAVGSISGGAPQGVFTLPSLDKLKSGAVNGCGTSFNFRLNLQSNNLTDDTSVPVVDNTSSLTYLDDFSSVFSSLVKGVRMMNNQTILLSNINETYAKNQSSLSFIKKDVDELKRNLGLLRDNTYNYNVLFNNSVVTAGTNVLGKIKEADRSIHIGSFSGYNTLTSNQNVMIGHESGYKSTNPIGCVFIGYRAGYNETGNNKFIIANNESENFMYGDFDAKSLRLNVANLSLNPDLFTISGSGVGLSIDANGNIVRSTSSIRYKENVESCPTDSSDVIHQMEVKTFNYKTDPSTTCVGFIAEELAELDERLITRNNKGEVESVRTDTVIAYLVDQVKKLQKQLDSVKK